MIKLQNVCKSYFLGESEIKAVVDVSLEIKKKEYISILGSSGSGKSTLMYLIGLLDQPTSGKILIEDKDVSKLNDNDLSNIRNTTVGFVFQSFNLINKFSVIENVLERKDFLPNKISGGQQQRVAIARALIMDPKIILADEPTGNLDSRTGEEILTIMENLNKEFNTTVILVTHEKEVAKRTKRQIYIKDGKIVKSYI